MAPAIVHRLTAAIAILLFVAGSCASESCSKMMLTTTPDRLESLPPVQGLIGRNAHKDPPTGQNHRMETFQCPRIFDNRKRAWCCSANTPDARCCEWRERSKEMSWGEYQNMLMIVLLVAAVALIMFLFCLVVAIKIHEQIPAPRRIVGARPLSSAPDAPDSTPMLPQGSSVAEDDDSEQPPTYDSLFSPSPEKPLPVPETTPTSGQTPAEDDPTRTNLTGVVVTEP